MVNQNPWFGLVTVGAVIDGRSQDHVYDWDKDWYSADHVVQFFEV